MLSEMPRVLPLALPSKMLTMTPAVSSRSATNSVLVGTFRSTNTATAATTTGIEALQAGRPHSGLVSRLAKLRAAFRLNDTYA